MIVALPRASDSVAELAQFLNTVSLRVRVGCDHGVTLYRALILARLGGPGMQTALVNTVSNDLLGAEM